MWSCTPLIPNRPAWSAEGDKVTYIKKRENEREELEKQRGEKMGRRENRRGSEGVDYQEILLFLLGCVKLHFPPIVYWS